MRKPFQPSSRFTVRAGASAVRQTREISSLVLAIPSLEANDLDAALVHEAAIGKIAGEQILKLLTLGMTEQEAEEKIINGFLK